ncbi:MAG: Gfo/Idh/MocA family oxidoreductase [Kiritimatiellaeota bacterium]|nr:Gfo/Idh/MocA family oxidoreductase [Kiritimatiellota bacterium]
MMSIPVGLWGSNGHQIHGVVERYPELKVVAFGAFADDAALRAQYPEAVPCATYEALLDVPGVRLVSLCSPLRGDQAGQAIAALKRGIHVYAEKPCCTTEAELDNVIAVAATGGAIFHEQAGTVCDQPWWAMRQIAQSGQLGDIVQVVAQKSYPFQDWRPLSETVDGGLTAQSGVHALRLVEHVTGIRIATIDALETSLGETRPGSDLKMASSMMGRLDNGGLFSATANYLNQPGVGTWGNEMLRVFGTHGMLEACDGGTRTRLVLGNDDCGTLDTSAQPPDWLRCFLDQILHGTPMPFDLATELHPTRMVLRAHHAAQPEEPVPHCAHAR